jgi:hypothetical protein
MAVSKLAFVAARLGRVQYMQQLATSVGARILTPNAQDTYLRAKQSLNREVNHPDRCGLILRALVPRDKPRSGETADHSGRTRQPAFS